MEVVIKLFGLIRETAQTSEITLKFEGNHVTVGDLKRRLGESMSELVFVSGFVVAVNLRVALDSASIRAEDEVALLPLISGG